MGDPFRPLCSGLCVGRTREDFPKISSLLPPGGSLGSSPEGVFKGTFIRRPYNISVKHAPGTRGYIYIVSLGDTLVLKIGWSNFRTAILGLQPKCCPSTIHKQKHREPSLITESCWKQTLHICQLACIT